MSNNRFERCIYLCSTCCEKLNLLVVLVCLATKSRALKAQIHDWLVLWVLNAGQYLNNCSHFQVYPIRESLALRHSFASTMRQALGTSHPSFGKGFTNATNTKISTTQCQLVDRASVSWVSFLFLLTCMTELPFKYTYNRREAIKEKKRRNSIHLLFIMRWQWQQYLLWYISCNKNNVETKEHSAPIDWSQGVLMSSYSKIVT